MGDLPSLTSVATPVSTNTKVGSFSDKQGGASLVDFYLKLARSDHFRLRQ